MITLHDVARWYQDKGLVGETRLALVQTVVAISGKPMGFGIEAAAGSGKTATMDLLIGDSGGEDTSLIYKKFVYFKDAGSQTSLFYDAEVVNSKKIIAIKELQKDKSDNMVEAIKSMTEGKSANRKVTDVANDEVKSQRVEPKTVIYSLAVENDMKPDTELRRRCIVMSTDISKEQTSKVLTAKARLRWDPASAQIMSHEESEEIRKTVNSLLSYKMTVMNPFAEKFVEVVADVAPDQKVRSMAEHFWNVMEGVVKLNAYDGNHVHIFNKGATTVIANIQDLLQTLIIYKEAFMRDVHSIPPMGDIVLRGFKDAVKVEATEKQPSSSSLAQFGVSKGESRWVDVNHLRKAIKEFQKVNMAQKLVLQVCRQLVDAGYLEDWKDGKELKFQVMDEFTEFENPDEKNLIEAARVLVEKKYPEKCSQWLESQYKSFTHPITGEEVTINA